MGSQNCDWKEVFGDERIIPAADRMLKSGVRSQDPSSVLDSVDHDARLYVDSIRPISSCGENWKTGKRLSEEGRLWKAESNDSLCR